MRRSGDGFVTAGDGNPRWGRFGAAGVLVRHVDGDGEWYFLARRSHYCHRGGTWAIPGGAIDEHEEPVVAAMREFTEETGIDLTDHGFSVRDIHQDDHGGWSYWTVVADVDHRFDCPAVTSWETDEVRWVPVDAVRELELFDAFLATLERLGMLPAT